MEASLASPSRERTPRRQGTTPGRLYHGREILGRDQKLEFGDDSVRCLGCGRRYDGNAQCACRREEHEGQSPLFPVESPRENLRPLARSLWRRTGRNLFGESPLCNSPRELTKLRMGAAGLSATADSSGAHPIVDPIVARGAHVATLLAAHAVPAGRRDVEREASVVFLPPPRADDVAATGNSRESISQTQRWSGTEV